MNVIHQGVGGITEADIMLAAASNALVVGFNVRPNAEARALAEREGVDIRTYRVIYQLTEDIEQALVGMLSAVQTEEMIGEAEVRALFRVSRLGTIAGCMVTSGVVRRNAQVRVVRDGTVIYDTTIAQLKRFKEDVREVAEGFECGILLDGFNDVKEGDVLEAYETREVERTSARRAAPARRPPRRRTPVGRVAVASGWVGILSVELHFPEAHSLKEKRMFVRSAKAQLQNRFGASVAEVDHHDVWQRARLTARVVAREPARRSGCSPRPSASSPRASGSSASTRAPSSSRSTTSWLRCGAVSRPDAQGERVRPAGAVRGAARAEGSADRLRDRDRRRRLRRISGRRRSTSACSAARASRRRRWRGSAPRTACSRPTSRASSGSSGPRSSPSNTISRSSAACA